MAFKQMVPPKVYKDTKDIQDGKKIIKATTGQIIITGENGEDDMTIKLNDGHIMNELSFYFMNEYGKEFGLLYLMALLFGKKAYKSTKKMFERIGTDG